MKKIYLYIFALLSVNVAIGQIDLSNNNWYFGQFAAINFSTNPPNVLLDSQINQVEGCATISDNLTGELLFYTDGTKIWNKNHVIMSNSLGLTGNVSSAQSAIIVRNPKNTNQFYVFTTFQSLTYSIVDMTLDSGMGNVIINKKNIPLLNEFGNSVNTWGEALTVATNEENSKYWILYPVHNKLYAYRLDEAGLMTAPVVSNLTFTDSLNPFNCIKVNIDNSKIVIGTYFNGASPYGAARVYNFNNDEGTINLNYEVQFNNASVYSAEFYKDNLFFSVIDNPQAGEYLLGFNTTFLLSNLTSVASLGTIQSAPNDFEVYVGVGQSGNLNINKITTPSNYASTVTYNALNVSGGSSNRKVRYGLPQLILPSLVPDPCHNDFTLFSPETYTNHTYNASNSITTNLEYSVGSNKEISLKAGEYILMLPNTFIESNSVFIAKIANCESLSLLKKNKLDASKEKVKHVINLAAEIKEYKSLNIYPNPSSTYVNISIENLNMQSITVSSIDGRIVFTKKEVNEATYKLDVSNYVKGIYLVTVYSENGEIITSKIIKN